MHETCSSIKCSVVSNRLVMIYLYNVYTIYITYIIYYTYVFVYIHICIYVYVYIYIYAIMKTMCPPGYHMYNLKLKFETQMYMHIEILLNIPFEGASN